MSAQLAAPVRSLEDVAGLLADAAEIVFDLKCSLPDPDDSDEEVAEWLRPALAQLEALSGLIHRAGSLADGAGRSHGALPVSHWWHVI